MTEPENNSAANHVTSPPNGKFDDLLHPLHAAQRQRAFLLSLTRILFLALFATVTLLTIIKFDVGSQRSLELTISWHITLAVAAVIASIVVLADVFTPTKKISTLFSIFFGLLGAVLATIAVGFVIDLIATSYDIKALELIGSTKVLIGIALAYLAISIVLQTQDDFRLVIPYVEFAKQLRGPRPLMLDTSALIDGRIVEVAQTGLIQSPVVVPRFVISELQMLADSADRNRRSRGRRGLDMMTRVQRFAGIDVTVDETHPGDKQRGVDEMLVELALATRSMIVTTDSGLRRVAEIRAVPVLFMADLSNALKPQLGPGDAITLRLSRKGEQLGQGVGYLEDGTMVVAEDGGDYVGQVVPLMIGSTMSTSAGRLLFARVVKEAVTQASEANEIDRTEEVIEVVETEEGPAESPQAAESVQPEPVQEVHPETTKTDTPRRGPFPPVPPKNIRGNTPRNPRR